MRAALALAALAPLARAHDGPPYPILVDREVLGESLSVWADPDVGEGTFYLYLPSEEQAADPGLAVHLFARPLDGSLPEVESAALRAEPGRPYQRLALVDFPARGLWSVRFVLESSAGRGEVAVDVDVTPPGFGKFDLLWFLTPFLLAGFVWLKAFLRGRPAPESSAPRAASARDLPPAPPTSGTFT